MVIRQFKITDKRRYDFGQIYDGFYLTDGSGDAQVQTWKGSEVIYQWEFELVTY